jgi:hypothetical protein
VASELAGSQITSLMEALPGIATVLRSPVADALIGIMRAAARIHDFRPADAEELVRYATRRGLLGNDEGERVLAEVHAAEQKRQERIAERQQRQLHPEKKPAPKAKAAKPKAAKPVARPAKAAKSNGAKAAARRSPAPAKAARKR